MTFYLTIGFAFLCLSFISIIVVGFKNMLVELMIHSKLFHSIL